MIIMDTTWNSTARQKQREGASSGDGGHDMSILDDDERIRQQFLLGLLERSTSAPPPSGLATGSTIFGADNGLSHKGGVLSSGGGLFAGSGRSSVPPGDFLLGSRNSEQAGVLSLPSSSSSPSLQQIGASDKLDFDDFVRHGQDGDGAVIGNFLDRPKSAAPGFPYGGMGSSHRPPPGLGGLRPTSAAPSSGGPGALLFESSSGYESTNAVRHAPPRPSSTGVIGQQSPNTSSTVMATLGLIPSPAQTSGGQNQRSIMDLIREDSPKAESPASLERHIQQRGQRHSAASPHSGSVSSHSEARYQQDQDGLSVVGRREEGDSALYKMNSGAGEANDGPSRNYVPQYDPISAVQLDQQLLGSRSPAPVGLSTFSQHNRVQQSPIYTNSLLEQQSRSQHVIYGNAQPGHHAMHHHPHQQSTYEAQTIYYSTQQQGRNSTSPVDSPQIHNQVQSQMQPQMIHAAPPGGHQAVFVNTPYGYATVQYHTGPPPMSHDHHAPPRHLLQSPHIGPGGHPIHQEYIIPLQTGLPTAGTYAYWQQGSDMAALTSAQGVPSPTTMTVLNAHGQPTTITVAGVAASSTVPLAAPQAVGGRQQGGRGGKLPSGGKSMERGTVGRGKRGVTGAVGGGGRRGVTGGLDTPKSPGGGGASSALLDEFRAAKTRNWVIHDIKGYVVEFCQDQNGSRFIQQRLEVAGTQEKEMVMAEVLPSVRVLRNDVFGNYVVQKLLEHGTPRMKSELKQTLEGEMLALSVQMYGCRVVQKALETLDDDLLPGLLTEFHGNVLSCIHDQNGNHVIQKCIEVMCSKAKAAAATGDVEMARFMTDQVQFILDDVLESVAPLSCHPYGCRVLQRILEHCAEDQKLRALDEIGKCHRSLLDDQYGNYVIQHVLQYGRPSDRDSILQIIVESGLLALSRQKFASNVVEKLLKYGSPEQRNAVVREMLKKVTDESANEGEGRSSVVLLMVRDAYANYVVQTTLDVLSEGEERRHLLEELNRHSSQLRNYTFAKHIVAKLGA